MRSNPSRQRTSTEPPPRQVRHELRTETRIGASGMNNLLEHDAANTPSPLECALEHGRTELQDERIRMRGTLLCPEIGQRTWFWFAVQMTSSGSEGCAVVPARVSPESFRPCSVTASGLMRRPAAGSFFCFYGFQKIFSVKTPHRMRTKRVSEPSANAELRPWESRPLARLRPV